jgi:hypothetical protein
MNKTLSLARKIRALQIGKPFTVSTEKDRQMVCRVAKALRDAGVIEFMVVTKRMKSGLWKVAVI